EAAARRLVERGVVVVEIQHSGLLRARQTADSLGAALGPPRGIRAVDALGPEDDPEEARGRLEASTEPPLLVGHLPPPARLVAALVGKEGAAAFQPAPVVCLARGVGAWTIEWVLDPPPEPTAP